jgi:hypothetical protein
MPTPSHLTASTRSRWITLTAGSATTLPQVRGAVVQAPSRQMGRDVRREGGDRAGHHADGAIGVVAAAPPIDLGEEALESWQVAAAR